MCWVCVWVCVWVWVAWTRGRGSVEWMDGWRRVGLGGLGGLGASQGASPVFQAGGALHEEQHASGITLAGGSADQCGSWPVVCVRAGAERGRTRKPAAQGALTYSIRRSRGHNGCLEEAQRCLGCSAKDTRTRPLSGRARRADVAHGSACVAGDRLRRATQRNATQRK